MKVAPVRTRATRCGALTARRRTCADSVSLNAIATPAARDTHADRTGEYVPLCNDGGIHLDGHMALAIAMGADFLMMGPYFARFDESPGGLFAAGASFYEEYWGEGSVRVRGTADGGTVSEESVDRRVPYAGSLGSAVQRSAACIRAAMVASGAVTLKSFR